MRKNLWYFTISLIAILGIVLFGLGPRSERFEVDAQATVPGTGTVSGTVTAPKAFKAAQVFLRNTDNNVMYGVYTAGGRYRAVALLPGNYEITVRKIGFAVDAQKVVIRAGSNATANFRMVEGVPTVAQQPTFGVGARERSITYVSKEALLPPGTGRDVLQQNCLVCHSESFFGQRQQNEMRWNTSVNNMIANDYLDAIPAPQRAQLISYLTTNFGPNSGRRALSPEFPLDEEALGKAMYVEYYLPLGPEKKPRMSQEPQIDFLGNVWFTERNDPNMIGMVDPRTGVVKDYAIPDPEGDPHGLTVDKFGDVWWAETNGWHLGRLNPRTGQIQRYSFTPETDPTLKGRGHTPVLDSKQNLWISIRDLVRGGTGVSGVFGRGGTGGGVDEPKDGIAKWERESGKMSVYLHPTPGSRPYGMLVDKNDNIWTALSQGCGVARFEPTTGKWTDYLSPTGNKCQIRRLGVDSQATTVWYGIWSGGGKLGKVDVRSGRVTEYDIPMPDASPYDTWTDHEDNVWISDDGQGGTLIKFEPKTEKWTYYPSPQITDMPKLAIGGNGAVWYCPRSSENAAVGVLYPDMSKITSLAAVRPRFDFR
jgi:virginiamycin B lyase